MFNRIYIEITTICNLNCPFCPTTNRKKESMTPESFEKIMKKISGYTKHIYLHVKGEPLMNEHLDDILKIANKYNMNVNITTNARLLKQKLDIINSNKIRQINISLHSFNSINEIRELLDIIDKINNIYISLRLWNNNDNKEIIDLLNRYYSKKIDASKRYTLKENIFLDKDILFDWPDINIDVISETGKCLGGKKQLAILVDGTVTLCCLDNDGINNLGNIFNMSLEEILNSNKYKKIISCFNNNKLISELCKRCGYRNRFDRRG